MQKAWEQVSDNREAHNLDQHNIRLVESNLRAGADTIAARITETYIWLLVPRQEAKAPLTIDALKVNGRGSLAARATSKAGDDGSAHRGFVRSRRRSQRPLVSRLD